MSYPSLAPSISHPQFTERTGQPAISGESQRQSPHTASIQILDDDSLLNVFHLYRPFLLGEDEDDDARLLGGRGGWDRGRWWYNLAHVCQRWRSVILRSSSYLNLSLICTKGTPVTDMLAHSPPLPLFVDCLGKHHDIAAEDGAGTILALKKRDRVRRVRLFMPATNLQKLIVAIDEEYPILEYLVIMRWIKNNNAILVFPETFQAPYLRHLVLVGFALPRESRLLTTAVGLVTLGLTMINPSTYFHPNTLLQWLSFMPQLETLVIGFLFPIPDHDIERQLTHTRVMTPVILPNLRRFKFRGVSTYLEALVHRITVPRLKKLEIDFFFSRLIFSVPRLLHFLNATENLTFNSAKFEFSMRRVHLKVYSRGEAEMGALYISVGYWHLDWQVLVSSVAQLSNSLSQMLSAVEHLTFEHKAQSLSSEEHNEADRTEWRKLLRSFRNVKPLRIDDGLVEEISYCLRLDDGESPLEMLPELQELTYSGSGNAGDAFTSFIDARQNAGRPVALIRH